LIYDPDPDADPASLTFTFGGAAPVASIRPGTVLSTWTRDCFAGRIAHAELVRWTCAETGLSTLDSYQLVSQAVRSPVANVVDTAYTMTAKLPKTVLPCIEPMGGTHRRLRGQAATWLAGAVVRGT
jgi:hypothetical protein